MVLAFPTVVSFIAAVSSFLCTLPWLRNFQLSEISPKLRARLSREERQKKITVGEGRLRHECVHAGLNVRICLDGKFKVRHYLKFRGVE